LWAIGIRSKPPTVPRVCPTAAVLDAYAGRNRFLESIDAAKHVLALEPASDRTYGNICAAYNRLQQWELGFAACNQVVRLNPANQLARSNLALGAARLRRGAALGEIDLGPSSGSRPGEAQSRIRTQPHHQDGYSATMSPAVRRPPAVAATTSGLARKRT